MSFRCFLRTKHAPRLQTPSNSLFRTKLSTTLQRRKLATMDVTSAVPAARSCAIPLKRSPTTSTSSVDFNDEKLSTDYDDLIKAVGDADVVMIGEASHGTHRAEVTRQLILKKGFNIIATESDWPDSYRLNRYIQKPHKSRDATAEEALGDFRRFPLWMWRNTVVRDFAEWLKKYNEKRDPEQKVAYYGMDLYSMYTSMDAVVEYLQQVDPEDAKKAKDAYSHFDRFQGLPHHYGKSTVLGLSRDFEQEVVKVLCDLRVRGEEYLKGVGGLIDGDELFYAKQNAKLVANAEQYYRKMYHGDESTWNLRDSHMAECVASLLDFHNEKHSHVKNKMIIWAHNSHLGDARFTDKGRRRGEHNVGQLIREHFGMDRTFNIGFSSYGGTVTAANKWDEPAHLLKVNPGMKGSQEELFHSIGSGLSSKDYYLVFRSNSKEYAVDHEMVSALSSPKLERYIGVIYKPGTERASHYSHSTITKEYDSLIYIDHTTALEPLDPTTTWQKDKQIDAKQAYH